MILETVLVLFLFGLSNGNFVPRPMRYMVPNQVPVYQQRYPMPPPRPYVPTPNYHPQPPPPPIRHMPVYKPHIETILKGEKCVDRTPHPQNPHQYIVCLPDGDYVIMDCPDGLVFNKYLDRCDYNANEVSICATQPCAHGGRCIEQPDHKYKCECLPGFNGENCEKSPDMCGLNPCGPGGECHTMPANSPIPFYCTCFHDKFYGLGCNRNALPNPCHSSESTESYFKVKFDPTLFIHCDGTNLHLKVCPKPLVFSTRDNTCDWASHDGHQSQQQSHETAQANEHNSY